MNIYEKLIEVRKGVPYLQKENEGYQYKYVGSSQVLGAVRAKMDTMGLLLVPAVKAHTVTTETTEKKSTSYFTELEMDFTWINAEKPEERIVCSWYGQGIDIAGEKGCGKAMTYAEKYFLLKFFNIATDKDDPDAFQRDNREATTPRTAPKAAPKPVEQAKPVEPIGTVAKQSIGDKSATSTDAAPTAKDWTAFWMTVRPTGLTTEVVHHEAAPYFNIPNLRSLTDVPGLTAARLEAFAKHLQDLVGEKSA